ncbi:hypothetical protein P43SY_007602 [Pythium insidiosum]|uniref:Mitochondrial Carrier (MC) Family n=1 Tax=Pythium insidiosum TaxID=114742 RepID=A0AAD5LAW3_PYTIN|nr:hypothetical protein P43SY_007602 [Pythium insidiosum]KAJ0398877.1 hypothetical protein ATCC90586_009808 [Pythium insidiosum]
MALSKPMQMLAAASAAGVGGLVATSVLYPLDTIKTRLQSGGSLFDEEETNEEQARRKDVRALLRSLYRGYQYKAAESSVSKFLYFYAYTLLAQTVAPSDGKPIGTVLNLGIGYLSEFFHLPVTLPMEVIATRLQTGIGSGGVLQIVRNVLEESGIKGFYKGFQAYFVLCLQPAIQYTVFERVKEAYLKRSKSMAKSLSALEAFVLGAIARSIATLLLFPYIRAKVILQSKKKKNQAPELEDGKCDRASQSSEGIVATLQRVYSEEGPLALYRGLTPELTKGALSSALMLMIKEKIQTYITLMLILANSME